MAEAKSVTEQRSVKGQGCAKSSGGIRDGIFEQWIVVEGPSQDHPGGVGVFRVESNNLHLVEHPFGNSVMGDFPGNTDLRKPR